MIDKTEGAAAALEVLAAKFDQELRELTDALPADLRAHMRAALRLVDALEQVAFSIRSGDTRNLKGRPERELYEAILARLIGG